MQSQRFWISARIFLSLFTHFELCKMCVGNYLPNKVVGIFPSNKSSPSQAALLAVEDVNWKKSSSFTFVYQHVTICVLKDDLLCPGGEVHKEFQNSLIITGNPDICEEISTRIIMAENTGSFLVIANELLMFCYGLPTPNTFQQLDSVSNLYLSNHNPMAIIPGLFKMVQLFQRAHPTSCSSMSFIVERNHPYHQIEKPLVQNLSQMNITRVSLYMLEKCHTLQVPMSGNPHVMVAILSKYLAQNLLCKLHKKQSYGHNIILLFAGLSGDELIKLIHENHHSHLSNYNDEDLSHDDGFTQNPIGNNSCTKEELLEAAEGHFIIEFPDWDTTDKAVQDELLYRRLGWKPTDFTEAPLAYDSVLAITQAITRTESLAVEAETQEERNNLIKEQLKKSFSGESGEFSFNSDKLRSWTKATIVIKRFENGTYAEIGRHSNANSSFFRLKDNFPFTGMDIRSSDNTSLSMKLSECYRGHLHPCDATLACSSVFVKVILFGILPVTLLLLLLMFLRKFILRRYNNVANKRSDISPANCNHQPLKNAIH